VVLKNLPDPLHRDLLPEYLLHLQEYEEELTARMR
jgi:hypothetical protein